MKLGQAHTVYRATALATIFLVAAVSETAYRNRNDCAQIVTVGHEFMLTFWQFDKRRDGADRRGFDNCRRDMPIWVIWAGGESTIDRTPPGMSTASRSGTSHCSPCSVRRSPSGYCNNRLRNQWQGTGEARAHVSARARRHVRVHGAGVPCCRDANL